MVLFFSNLILEILIDSLTAPEIFKFSKHILETLIFDL